MRPSLIAGRSPASIAATVLATAALPLAFVAPQAAQAQADGAQKAATYIVQVDGPAIASYRGGDRGYAATKPARGKKVNMRSTAAKAYKQRLVGKHTEVLAAAGIAASAKRDDFTVAFNGFTASLTAAQVADLQRTPGVLRVWKNEVRTADTVGTPKFLGLEGAGGTWAKEFGGDAHAGEGMIVGVIDSGIWPESQSFSALSEPRPDAAAIAAKWRGVCDAGETGDPVTCNNKLIGARYYLADNAVPDFEFRSPRGYNSHGTHTAATAAGNHGVAASINGGSVGTVSGMAPAARIASYKALWATPDGRASGTTGGLVHAIDDAVADGVDVINYSISGSSTYVVSPDELAFLGAADAGVFVSTSAGNSGEDVGESSVAHNSPWEITVAASTHDRGAAKTVTLGNGATYSGVGVGPAVASAPLVISTDAAAAGKTTEATLCYSSGWAGGPGLDPAKVAGKIVVCTRGVNDRVDKSKAVKEAGGVGMILANASAAQSLAADFHSLPSIHVSSADGAAIKSYVAGNANATAAISAQDPTPVEAPAMAGFSSYGPALAGNGNLLKPDITAPGVDVIAAVSPKGDAGNTFNAMSGTSMSAPHIAGIAALVRAKHPDWSPMMVKSALMTTASPLDNKGNPIKRGDHDATPLDFGAGHVRPGSAFDPGLVYDSDAVDWIQYGCGIGQFQLISSTACETYGSIDPSDFNAPSIAVGALAGKQTITRTVFNVSPDQASTYKPVVSAPAGFTAKVNVDKLVVPPLQSRTYKVTLTRTTAPLGEYAFGSITLVDKRGHSVRSPIAVRPVAVAAPAETAVSGASGSQSVAVRTGFGGTLTAAVNGLVPADVRTVHATLGTNGQATVEVPAGTKVVRFATYDADYAGGTDIDFTVQLNGEQVGVSAGGTAEEAVTLTDPAPGTYTVDLDLFAGAPELDLKLNAFVVGSADAGNLAVTPASQTATTGGSASVDLAWSGLAATRHLGIVSYGDGTSEVGRTLVSVTP